MKLSRFGALGSVVFLMGCPGLQDMWGDAEMAFNNERQALSQLQTTIQNQPVGELSTYHFSTWVERMVQLDRQVKKVYRNYKGLNAKKRAEADASSAIASLRDALSSFFQKPVSIRFQSPDWFYAQIGRNHYPFPAPDSINPYSYEKYWAQWHINVPQRQEAAEQAYQSLRETFAAFESLEGAPSGFSKDVPGKTQIDFGIEIDRRLADTMAGCIDTIGRYATNAVTNPALGAAPDPNCFKGAYLYCNHQMSMECMNNTLRNGMEAQTQISGARACSSPHEHLEGEYVMASWMRSLKNCKSDQLIYK